MIVGVLDELPVNFPACPKEKRGAFEGPFASALERAGEHWTQEQAAETARTHSRHYQKLEEGSVNVTVGTLERLSRGFGVDVRSCLRCRGHRPSRGLTASLSSPAAGRCRRLCISASVPYEPTAKP